MAAMASSGHPPLSNMRAQLKKNTQRVTIDIAFEIFVWPGG